MARHARLRSLRAHTLALIAYIVGSLFATWPLAAHFTTHVPGDGIDDPALAWNLWWLWARLIEQRQLDIFHVDWLFHPIDINLGFYTLTPLNGLLSIPLQSATSLIIANNVLLLSSFVLGGYGTFLLVQTVWSRQWAKSAPQSPWTHWSVAWLAGAFYAFAATKLFYASLGQFNIASSQWIPFCVLYVWRTLYSQTSHHATHSSWRNGALAGGFLVLQAWAELTYASFLLIFFALAYLFFTITWLQTRTPRTHWWRGTQGMLAAAIVFVVGIGPFLAAMLPDLRTEGDFFASGGGFADSFSADLLGYLVPTRLHPWLGDWVATLPFANDKAQHIYLGYTLLTLIIIGALHRWRTSNRRITLFWLLTLLIFWLLTLGPNVRWAGDALPIPGPFAIISQLPFFSGNRYPSRYAVMLLLAAAVIATPGLLWLCTRLAARQHGGRARLLLATVAILFTVEHIAVPLPLSDFRIPPIYQAIAAQPGDFAILELPTGWRNGARVLGKSDILIMMQQWYQTAHGKRRLGGNTSRNPAYKFQYYSATPLLANLIAYMNADRPHLAPLLEAEHSVRAATVRTTAPALFDLLGIRYVTLHVEKSPALLQQLVTDALPVTLVDEWHGTDWTGAPSTIRLYAVNDPAPVAPLAIDLATDDAQMYLAEGWSPGGAPGTGRFATRPNVDLLLPRSTQGHNLTLTYAAPNTVSYTYQGESLGTHSGSVHTLQMPLSHDTDPTTRLTLHFSETHADLTTLTPQPTPIGSTGSNLPPGVAIMAQSAGEETGNLAHLWVNGVDWASGERGYNLVALTSAGEVIANATFDTFSGESSAMAAWLNQWQPGTIIAGAVADTAEHLSGEAMAQDAINALARLGVAGDIRGKFRWSHAFIGVVGAPSATAIEELSLVQPVTVWSGVPLPAERGYGPLQRIQVTP